MYLWTLSKIETFSTRFPRLLAFAFVPKHGMGDGEYCRLLTVRLRLSAPNFQSQKPPFSQPGMAGTPPSPRALNGGVDRPTTDDVAPHLRHASKRCRKFCPGWSMLPDHHHHFSSMVLRKLFMLRPTRFDIRSRGLCCIFVIYCKSAFDIAHCLYCRSILCCYGLAAIGDCVTDQRLGRLVAIDVLYLIRPLNGDGIVTLSKFNYQIGCSNSSVVLSYSR